MQEITADILLTECIDYLLNDNISEEVAFEPNRKIDCSEIIAKLEIASKLVNNAAPGIFEEVVKRNMYFVNGAWIKLIGNPCLSKR